MAGKCAYVTLLYGTSGGYTLGAAVLGRSLGKSAVDRVLLHTQDVPKKHVGVLGEFYDVVREVDYIRADPGLIKGFDSSPWKGVFTKLHCLALTEYEKVLFVDADVLVLRPLDGLFQLEAPAGVPMIAEDLELGTRVVKERFYYPGGGFRTGINGGLMLFRPNRALFDEIVSDVTTVKPRATAYRYPEQDYLSERWAGDWRFVSHWYNFQFHLRRDPGMHEKYAFEHLKDRVYAVHYSALLPWLFLWPQTDPVALRRYVEDAPAMRLWLEAFSAARLDLLETRGFDLLSLADP